MTHEKLVNGFEIDAAGVVSVIDLDAIAIGGEKECSKISLEDRDFLKVSSDFRIKMPARAGSDLEEYVIAPLPFNYHSSGSVICFRACKADKEDIVIDMGITFEGDSKSEFGHYFLWNPENGELSLSEEMDWLEVTKADLKRWEMKLEPDGAVR